MTSQDFLNAVHGHCRALRYMADDLRNYASALQMAGNTVLAARLREWSAELATEQRSLLDAYNTDLIEQRDASTKGLQDALLVVLGAKP